MGYDLEPRNKELDSYHFGAFSWTWMLNEGVGLVIGTGPAKNPAEYSYIPDKKGKDPNCNDGFYVNAEQARMMAYAANGLVSVQRFINKQWDELSEEERDHHKAFYEINKIYKIPVREDFIEKVDKFAKWAISSKGFWIY